MDYQTINIIIGALVALFGTWEGINNIRYRRENKKLKQNEVKVSDVETQKQQIDLVVYFKDQVLKVLEDVQKAQHTGNDNQVQIMRKIDKVEDKVGDIETYLNGPYHKWLSEKEKGEGQ